MIEFLCPNEHKIRCPDDKAGRPAKCPKCGVSFRIPMPEELSVGASEVFGPPAVAETDGAAPSPWEGGAAPATAAGAANPRQIEFLCPNGHHLHGPAALQGRAGECPECGSRFRIPVIDQPEAAPEPLAEPQLADEAQEPLAEKAAMALPAPPDGGVGHAAAEPFEYLQVLDEPEVVEGPSPVRGFAPPAGAGGAHPLAALFAELWAARDESSRVEVHLESGSLVTPDGYLKSHSMRDYAVLVTKDPDGRSTVTIVPWNSIARIILRALKDVPGEVVR